MTAAVSCREHLDNSNERAAAGMLIMAGGGNGTPLDYDELERRGSAVSGG